MYFLLWFLLYYFVARIFVLIISLYHGGVTGTINSLFYFSCFFFFSHYYHYWLLCEFGVVGKSRHLCAALIYLTQYLSGSHGETLGSQWFFRFHCGVLGLEPGHQACMASSFTCSAISLALFSFSWLSFENYFLKKTYFHLSKKKILLLFNDLKV